MALIPESEAEFLDEEVEVSEAAEEEIAPARTWEIDFVNGRIGGFVDDEAALRQFIRKALLTERDKYAVYSDDYGCELQTLIGENVTDDLLDSEIPRMVSEALIYDDRIDDVQTEFRREGEKLYITAIVIPAHRDVEIVEEVEI